MYFSLQVALHSHQPHKYLNQTQSHPDLMVDVMGMLVPAALHFGQEQPSSSGVAGIHVCVKIAAHATNYLRLVEEALNRYTRERRHIIITRFTSPIPEKLIHMNYI